MSSSAAAIAVNSAINTLDSNLNSCARKRRSLINAKESIVEEVFGGKDKSGEIPRPRDDFIETPKKSPKRKKFNSNHEKPMWKTVLSIMIKNGLLLVFLITLGHTIWKYSVVTKGFSHFLIAPALVDQINDIKETAKTLQYQLQVVESKIEGEINFLKEGLTEEINERSNSLETLFRELEVRSDDLEISLNKLKNADFFSREDLQKIIGEIKKTHGSGASAPQLTLDEMRNYAREIIVRELEKHSADGIGRVDFALASGSGRVISHSEAFNYGKSSWFFPSRGGSVHPNAQKMLQPSFGEPGQCFALRGCSGFVEIKLRTGIIPDSVTLEHVSKVLFFILRSSLNYFFCC